MNQLADDLRETLIFFTRLPFTRREGIDPPPMSRAVRTAPLAGVIIGAIGALTILVADALSLPGLLSALLALSAMALSTGALHEDGLADTADGFGGGATPEKTLDIMRDSTIGAYGALALILVIAIKAACLSALLAAPMGPSLATSALIAGGACSRTAMVWLMAKLEPARADGLSAAAGRPEDGVVSHALIITAIVLIVVALISAGIVAIAIAAIGAFAATIIVEWRARAHINGQTGDVLGAGQQLAETGFLLLLVIAVSNL